MEKTSWKLKKLEKKTHSKSPKTRGFEEKLDFSCVWTLCGHCVAVPWPLKVQENEKKSTCGGSRRRAGPGPLGPWGLGPLGPARLPEVSQIDFCSHKLCLMGSLFHPGEHNVFPVGKIFRGPEKS